MAQPETQDLVSVGSRVSWGAILAGAFVALTLCIFLGVLGGTLNLTAADTNVRGDQLAIGAGIWAILSLLVALFIGGFVASRTTVGERKSEALMYGVLVWAVLVGMMTALAAAGSQADLGFNSYLRGTQTTMAQPNLQQPVTGEMLQKANVNLTEQQRNNLNQQLAQAHQATANTNATAKAWWAFAGIGFSLFAAIIGALVGAGPELVLRYWGRRRVVVTPPPPH
jgi:hypothetical protein